MAYLAPRYVLAGHSLRWALRRAFEHYDSDLVVRDLPKDLPFEVSPDRYQSQPNLEKALVRGTHHDWGALGDWLVECGDGRGEMIHLILARKVSRRIQDAFVAAHLPNWLGDCFDLVFPEAARVVWMPGQRERTFPFPKWGWEKCFASDVHLAGRLSPEGCAQLLTSSSMRLCRSLRRLPARTLSLSSVRLPRLAHLELVAVYEELSASWLAESAPELRSLDLGWVHPDIGVGLHDSALPGIERYSCSHQPDFVLPNCTRLRIDGSEDEVGPEWHSGRFPAVRELVVDSAAFDAEATTGDAIPLDRVNLPTLRRVRIDHGAKVVVSVLRDFLARHGNVRTLVFDWFIQSDEPLEFPGLVNVGRRGGLTYFRRV
jgi:hypothetical protein